MAEVSNWAETEDDLPSPQITDNGDGTKTVISYRLNDKGQKVKVTQRIKETKIIERVHPEVAKRKKWAKFGEEKDTPPGPDFRTTQLGEPVYLRLGTQWKQIEREEEKQKQEEKKHVPTQGIKCRLCGGAHFTTKCPFKSTLGADAENADASATPEPSDSLAGAGANGSGYVPPHMRNRGAGGLHMDGERKERDDSKTLRFTQLNETVDDEDLRELLGNLNPYVERLTIVRNRETGRSKGVAYVEFTSIEAADLAVKNLDGHGFHSLILRVEFSKPRPQR